MSQLPSDIVVHFFPGVLAWQKRAACALLKHLLQARWVLRFGKLQSHREVRIFYR